MEEKSFLFCFKMLIRFEISNAVSMRCIVFCIALARKNICKRAKQNMVRFSITSGFNRVFVDKFKVHGVCLKNATFHRKHIKNPPEHQIIS